MKVLSGAQLRVLDAIKAHIEHSGVPPTISEIASDLGVFPNAVYCHLQTLERKGAIALVKGTHRNIRIIEESA